MSLLPKALLLVAAFGLAACQNPDRYGSGGAGGYGGARVARRIPPDWLRGGIVLTGLVMSILFFAKA